MHRRQQFLRLVAALFRTAIARLRLFLRRRRRREAALLPHMLSAPLLLLVPYQRCKLAFLQRKLP